MVNRRKVNGNAISKQQWLTATLNRRCPLCTSASHQVISRSMQHRLDLTTVICRECGFVFTNPVPPRSLYERFYRDAYATYYGPIAPRPGAQNRRICPQATSRRLDWIESERGLKGTRLLELGPGQGLFLWWARQRGASVLGVEPSKDFCQTLREAGLPYRGCTLEDLTATEAGAPDVVVMFHVLEHFYDPNSGLAACHKLLAPGGLLAIEVPNILKPYRSLDRYFLRYVHLSNFSLQTLEAFLHKHGFALEFVDEGGRDWRQPQSTFVIARKLERTYLEFEKFFQPPGDVLKTLRRYRLRWRCWTAPAWYTWYSYTLVRRMAFRAASKAKRNILALFESLAHLYLSF